MTTPVVLITGDIGRATALAFVREGAQLVVSGQREEEGHKLAAKLVRIEVGESGWPLLQGV
jgi:NAD(P)-dependent dehydrogenase (short-subunit alcohol dehydrogenase family)